MITLYLVQGQTDLNIATLAANPYDQWRASEELTGHVLTKGANFNDLYALNASGTVSDFKIVDGTQTRTLIGRIIGISTRNTESGQQPVIQIGIGAE